LGVLSNHLGQAITQDVHDLTRDRIALMKDVFGKGCVAMNNKPLGRKEGWK
jgi:hypothetical protein